VLLSGHHVRGRVKRTVKRPDGTMVVRFFRTFAPVAYNHIGDLPEGFDTFHRYAQFYGEWLLAAAKAEAYWKEAYADEDLYAVPM
jgi:hypothetical protein